MVQTTEQLEREKDSGLLLLTEEVAEKLRVNVQWIYDQVKLGRLHPFRLSRRDWRWHWETVLADLKKMQ